MAVSTRPVALAVLLSFAGLSCSGDLTRDRAAKLIEESEQFQSQRPGFLAMLRRDASLASKCGKGTLWNQPYQGEPHLTPAGADTYHSVGTYGGFTRFKLRKPAKLLTITGITGQDKLRQVDFTWEYENLEALPAPVTECIDSLGGADRVYMTSNYGQHTGSASFQLYDDGWRIINLEVEL